MNAYWKKKFIQDVLIACFIVILPFSLFLHTLFEDTENGLAFFGVLIGKGTIMSEWYVYNVLVRLINIILLLIWFFSTPCSWKKFILVPVGVNLYFLFEYHLSFYGLEYTTDVFISILTSFFFILLFTFIDSYVNSEIVTLEYLIHQLKTAKEFDLKKLKRFYFDLERHVSKMELVKNSHQKKEALRGLFHIKYLVENKIYKIRNTYEVKRFDDFMISAFLVFISILLIIDRFIPGGTQILNLGLINITNNGFNGVSENIWTCSLKICSILPLTIWYTTTHKWWRYALFSPIIIFSYQLYSIIFNTSPVIDENEYLTALPFIMIIVFVLVFLSNLIKYQSKIMDLHESVTNDIELLLKHPDFQSEVYRKRKEEFERLKGNRHCKKKASANFGELLKLRNHLAELIKGWH